jgi:hypothetical protein
MSINEKDMKVRKKEMEKGQGGIGKGERWGKGKEERKRTGKEKVQHNGGGGVTSNRDE